MKARIVIGANFGDEGKGIVTDYLCSQGAGVVVRFNGGAQAGHTVVTPEGERHVFHHFGSGTLCEVPTFLSQFFVCNPILFFKELDELIALGYHPKVYAHPDCTITTLWDMMVNQYRETQRGGKRHGSCGVGVHETMIRDQVSSLRITMGDLWNGKNIETELAEISGKFFEYRSGMKWIDYTGCAIAEFIKLCERFADYITPAGIGSFDEPVFEGAQGLLLDQDNKEFFPHVTHSSTGMKNVEVLCGQAGITEKEIYYVSRTYLTRHGAGPLPDHDPSMDFEDDTNIPNEWQGALRFAPLDVRALKKRCREDAKGQEARLVLTHCDQLAAPCEADIFSFGPTRSTIEVGKSVVMV